jgi:Tol biopolymer transport system component
MRQLTFGGSNHRPIWSRDGKRIVFTSDRQGDSGLFWQPADGSGVAEELTKPESGRSPQSEMWSPVADVLLFSVSGPPRSLWTFAAGIDRKPKGLMEATAFSLSNASFSPDGKWIAYMSDESGAGEIFVQPFPLTGAKYRISSGGGYDPLWSPDGKLFYVKGQAVALEGRRIMSVDIQTQPKFVVGNTTPLPVDGIVGTGPRNYDIMPDGRFIVVLPGSPNGAKSPPPQFSVTLNWFEELKQRVPVK